MISPDDIIRAIEKHYEGGGLMYNEQKALRATEGASIPTTPHATTNEASAEDFMHSLELSPTEQQAVQENVEESGVSVIPGVEPAACTAVNAVAEFRFTFLRKRSREETLSKIITAATAALLADAYRRNGIRIAFTNGCFDMLHIGHLHSLECAAANVDILFVAVNSDKSVERLKGPSRPIIPESERLHLLASLSCVDHVILMDNDNPRYLVEMIQPNVLVKGPPYAKSEVAGADIVHRYGGTVEIIEGVPAISTSTIVQKILASGS